MVTVICIHIYIGWSTYRWMIMMLMMIDDYDGYDDNDRWLRWTILMISW